MSCISSLHKILQLQENQNSERTELPPRHICKNSAGSTPSLIHPIYNFFLQSRTPGWSR